MSIFLPNNKLYDLHPFQILQFLYMPIKVNFITKGVSIERCFLDLTKRSSSNAASNIKQIKAN